MFKNSVIIENGRPVDVEGKDELVPANTTIIAIFQHVMNVSNAMMRYMVV